MTDDRSGLPIESGLPKISEPSTATELRRRAVVQANGHAEPGATTGYYCIECRVDVNDRNEGPHKPGCSLAGSTMRRRHG